MPLWTQTLLTLTTTCPLKLALMLSGSVRIMMAYWIKGKRPCSGGSMQPVIPPTLPTLWLQWRTFFSTLITRYLTVGLRNRKLYIYIHIYITFISFIYWPTPLLLLNCFPSFIGRRLLYCLIFVASFIGRCLVYWPTPFQLIHLICFVYWPTPRSLADAFS